MSIKIRYQLPEKKYHSVASQARAFLQYNGQI